MLRTAPGFIIGRRKKDDDRPRQPPRFTKVTGCHLIMAIIFAMLCIILSACSPSGFRSLDINTVIGMFVVIFLVLCIFCFLLFISRILPLCAANVNLVDPPTGDRSKRSRSRSSSEMSLANRNQNPGSRRGSAVSISTPYDHFAASVRRPSTSSTALVTPTQTRAPNSPNDPENSADPFESFTGLSVESLPPPPYDTVNKVSEQDKLSITDMPSPKHFKSNLCSKCATAKSNEQQDSSEELKKLPSAPPAYELLDKATDLEKGPTENQDSLKECLNVCPECGTINVMEANKTSK